MIACIPIVFISASGVRGEKAKPFRPVIGGRPSFWALYAFTRTNWAGRAEVEELLLEFEKLELEESEDS